jgi:neopullulanase
MDYPLAEAILGYVGGPSIDWGIVRGHLEYRDNIRPLDGPAFAERLLELLGLYDPDVVAVQLNLISSHDAPRAQAVLGGDGAALRLATLLQATLPGAPCIYYGDEIGLTGGNDPANRGAFPWDESRWDRDLRTFVRSVLRLRSSTPALRHGSTTTVAASGSAMAFERRFGDERLIVVAHPGTDPMTLEIAVPDLDSGWLEPVPLDGAGTWSTAADGSTSAAAVRIEQGRARLALAPRTGRVVRVRSG